MKVIINIKQLLKGILPKEFNYKGQVYSYSGSSAESMGTMLMGSSSDNMKIYYRAYSMGYWNGDGSTITILYKIINGKIVPYRVIYDKEGRGL